MKMNIRPVTLLLLIILLVVGANAALYHFGMFDSFFAKKEAESRNDISEGPVVRKEVTRLVLPLKSSENSFETASDDGVIESDITTETSTSFAQAGAADKVNSTPSSDDESTDKSVQAAASEVEEVIAAKAVANSSNKAAAKKKAPVKTASKTVGGSVGKLLSTCSPDMVAVKVPLSSPAGRIKWFNLQSPRRLVVDILGKWDNKGKSLYKLEGCPVKKIVTGEHADKIRLVFYISKKDAAMRIKPAITKNSAGIELTINL
ncbi:AMIN domain-containing protein [Maridesulfovibrio hydrothermalis]|uniref:AMIN domain-containing protein n=1 Tax=Maridesulfovibrio hydrothermalis AM13 = DSM 14728 TaxID=1121451 RepID=L0R7I0_9BACT|nr:AMIN domain-containing protein [Maridesulfovibrio hydrothermalis]CCO22694.1 conserved exported protein of unknown function [Maridesulfovibrio hydrothermalis AM13 = DSM 14728]